jgi:outer membrane lipoprotein-sorting protein
MKTVIRDCLTAGTVAPWFLGVALALAQPDAPQEKPFQNEPSARALYDQMVKTMRQAKSLSWVSEYRWEVKGDTLGKATYRIWLKKPNYVRLEAAPAGKTKPIGILVGDGDYFWVYWPDGKPRYPWEYSGKYGEDYEKHRLTFYMKARSPVGRHSIGHRIDDLGAGTCMTIIDPSTFHGYTDSLQTYLDGVQGLGVEKVGNEECDVIEASFMKRQQSWYLWLARADHLPRKLKQVVRVSHAIIAHELWSEVAINGEMANDKFVWSAPAGWKEWETPPIEEGLLKPGTVAPDFELASTDGGKIKLSQFRGKIVWLNLWRCG